MESYPVLTSKFSGELKLPRFTTFCMFSILCYTDFYMKLETYNFFWEIALKRTCWYKIKAYYVTKNTRNRGNVCPFDI